VTFSLVGRCATSGQVGVAISSSSPAVAARCARVRAGAGAVSSQNVTDPRLGPAVLDELAAGTSAGQAVAAVVERAGALAAYRQLLAVDRSGTTAIHSGERALGLVATRMGDGCAAAGNLLADDGVVGALVEAFAADPALPLPDVPGDPQ
jgi:uncharacterized Ntn-hydrolase superfamily protein